jgi:hypothetical protein
VKGEGRKGSAFRGVSFLYLFLFYKGDFPQGRMVKGIRVCTYKDYLVSTRIIPTKRNLKEKFLRVIVSVIVYWKNYYRST